MGSQAVNFRCAGCSKTYSLDQFDDDEYPFWKTCVDHYQRAHPERVAQASLPRRTS